MENTNPVYIYVDDTARMSRSKKKEKKDTTRMCTSALMWFLGENRN